MPPGRKTHRSNQESVVWEPSLGQNTFWGCASRPCRRQTLISGGRNRLFTFLVGHVFRCFYLFSTFEVKLFTCFTCVLHFAPPHAYTNFLTFAFMFVCILCIIGKHMCVFTRPRLALMQNWYCGNVVVFTRPRPALLQNWYVGNVLCCQTNHINPQVKTLMSPTDPRIDEFLFNWRPFRTWSTNDQHMTNKWLPAIV